MIRRPRTTALYKYAVGLVVLALTLAWLLLLLRSTDGVTDKQCRDNAPSYTDGGYRPFTMEHTAKDIVCADYTKGGTCAEDSAEAPTLNGWIAERFRHPQVSDVSPTVRARYTVQPPPVVYYAPGDFRIGTIPQGTKSCKVSEPGTLALLGLGLLAAVWVVGRRTK